jgi:hypothetical protein
MNIITQTERQAIWDAINRVECELEISDEEKESGFAKDIALLCIYAAKAFSQIERLRSANDELFRLKQKVVIANRELLLKLFDQQEQVKRYNERLSLLGTAYELKLDTTVHLKESDLFDLYHNDAFAAEREELDAIKEGLVKHGYTFDGNIADATLHFVQQLHDKLADERKRNKTLVEALARIADGQSLLFPAQLRAIATNALAKVKEPQ